MSARRALALLAASAVLLGGCFGPPGNRGPDVFAGASAAQAGVGEEVIFTGTAHDPDGSIVRFEWDFEGDGTVDFSNATRGTAAHRFLAPGNFTAAFTAFDNRGAAATARVSVAVVARFSILSEWGAAHAYRVVHAAELDQAKVVVRAYPPGAPTPVEFRTGAGLSVLSPTSLRIVLASSPLSALGAVRIAVEYNGTGGPERTFLPVPFAGSRADPSVVFDASVEETRTFANAAGVTQMAGNLYVDATGSVVAVAFNGSGSSTATSAQAGTNTTASYTFTSLRWNHSYGRENGAFSAVAYGWNGTGTLSSLSDAGFATNITLALFEGSRFLGNLTFERAAGAGNFSGTLVGTSGAVTYSLVGSDTLTVLDGSGVARRALRLVENTSFAGTFGGAAFTQTNVTERLTAAHESLLNPDLHVAWNTSGALGPTSLNDSGQRFLDSDGNGAFNPDARPLLPTDSPYFAGLCPEELEEGDQFTLRSALGWTALVAVGAPSTQVLLADGFSPVAIEVAPVAGVAAGPGLSSGNVTYAVVATGVHAGLRLASREALATANGEFLRALTLAGRVA